MEAPEKAGRRSNQRQRTRKDLLRAAARLLETGRAPTMDEVAEEAMVSRATAYRYFPTIEALLVEAPMDDEVSNLAAMFAGDSSADPGERLDRAEAALHDALYRNEARLRLMLAHSLQASLGGPARSGDSAGGSSIDGATSGGASTGSASIGGASTVGATAAAARPSAGSGGNDDSRTPLRQNRRSALIEAALAPVRDRFDDAAYEDLTAALALVFGTESMIVFRDVLPLPPERAREVKRWAIRALVAAALERSGSAPKGKGRRGDRRLR